MTDQKSAGQDPSLLQKAAPKKLVEVQLFEVSMPEGGVDHQVSASIKTGGMLLSYSTTFDTIRQFFTERRRRAAEDKKKAV